MTSSNKTRRKGEAFLAFAKRLPPLPTMLMAGSSLEDVLPNRVPTARLNVRFTYARDPRLKVTSYAATAWSSALATA